MNQDNSVKIEECFRSARITSELSDSSIEKYRDSIKKFLSVTGDKKLESLTTADFDNFILEMRDNGASNSRIANVISAAKWLVKRLQDENKISMALDLEKVRKPKIGRKDVAYLTEKEIGMFLGAIRDDISKGPTIRKVRFEALAILLLQTGARIGEALSIKTKDIDRQNMEVNIIGKGNKPRTLFLKEETIANIDKYLSLRTDKHKSLFVTLNGSSQWEQTDVGRSFRRYKNLSGIGKHFTIHTLRHTFASQLVTRGVPMNTVQYFLGHSNLETTMKYYIGAVEKNQARQFMNDKYFDFIPSAVVEVGK